MFHVYACMFLWDCAWPDTAMIPVSFSQLPLRARTLKHFKQRCKPLRIWDVRAAHRFTITLSSFRSQKWEYRLWKIPTCKGPQGNPPSLCQPKSPGAESPRSDMCIHMHEPRLHLKNLFLTERKQIESGKSMPYIRVLPSQSYGDLLHLLLVLKPRCPGKPNEKIALPHTLCNRFLQMERTSSGGKKEKDWGTLNSMRLGKPIRLRKFMKLRKLRKLPDSQKPFSKVI